MSYDLILRASKDLTGDSVRTLSSELEKAAAQLGSQIRLKEGASFLPGESLGWLSLPGDPAVVLSRQQVSVIEELVLLGRKRGFNLYDPQRRDNLTEEDLQELSTDLVEGARQLVLKRLGSVLGPHGFKLAGELRFTRPLDDLFQHLVASLIAPGEGIPGRMELQAGWTLKLDDPEASIPEDVKIFTYMENVQSIVGMRGRFTWNNTSELALVLDRLEPDLEGTVLPWLEVRRNVQDLLGFYRENPSSEEGNGLYFGDEPNSYWLLAQVYRSRGNQQAELDELRLLVQEASSDGHPPSWLAELVEKASKRIEVLSHTR